MRVWHGVLIIESHQEGKGTLQIPLLVKWYLYLFNNMLTTENLKNINKSNNTKRMRSFTIRPLLTIFHARNSNEYQGRAAILRLLTNIFWYRKRQNSSKNKRKSAYRSQYLHISIYTARIQFYSWQFSFIFKRERATIDLVHDVQRSRGRGQKKFWGETKHANIFGGQGEKDEGRAFDWAKKM